ncbi:concanavalin A-like lectin/glucanase domain-containing protein [Aspergillus unguis]
MASTVLSLLLALTPLSYAQQIGSPEARPLLTTHYCTKADGCIAQNTSVVVDAATHNIHSVTNPKTSCTTADGTLDATLCPDKETCAQNCIIEGISDYAANGVSASGSELTLTMYANGSGNGSNSSLSSLSPRVYLVSEENFNINATATQAEDKVLYNSLRLLNQEFTFTVDVSLLPCGMNGALYLSEMAADGGRSALNPAGAAYGTGYCDAQCYVTPWINGEGNVNGYGSCCNEMDIWEANSRSTGLTPHACVYEGGGVYECEEEEECDSASENTGVCDKWGCGFNPYALGEEAYYGRGADAFEVDTQEPFTVVTQFVTDDNTTEGSLAAIRRLYIQHGQIIQNAVVTVDGAEYNSITDSLCDSTSSWFSSFGGLDGMGKALDRGMVLAMSIWNDAGGYMQWMDGLAEGAGPCNATEGAPSVIEQTVPGTKVVFSDLRWGDIGTTYN